MGKIRLFVLSLSVLAVGAMVVVRPANARQQAMPAENLVKDPGLRQMLSDAHSHQADTQFALNGGAAGGSQASPGLSTDGGHKSPTTGKMPPELSSDTKLPDDQNSASTATTSPTATPNPISAPKVATIAELLSGVDVKTSPAKPFLDETAARAKAKQGKLSMSSAMALASKGSASISGRTIAISGTVVSTAELDGGMKQILVATPSDSRRVAFLITLPRGDEHEAIAGQNISLNAIAIQTIYKPKYKGALVTALGGGLSDWSDEGAKLSELATNYGHPISGSTSAPESKGLLHGWEIGGVVNTGKDGVAVLRKAGGKVIYAGDGELVEPGLRVIKATIDSVDVRVDNKPISVHP